MSELPETVESAQDFITDVMDSKDVGERHPKWHKHVALTTLIMALLTALGAMLASISANQSLIDRTQEVIELNSLEGDRIYVETLKSKHEILTTLGETPDQAEIKEITAFEKETQELDTQAAGEETLVLTATKSHHVFAIAVALLSLGTALCGMSIIVNQKYLWGAGLLFGAIGTAGLGLGVLRMLF
ncbi:DUF4337 family protein [Chloroflexota bacterium]